MLRLTRSCRCWSRVIMPNCWPVWIDEYICATLSSRIRFRIAGVPTMISHAAVRPPPTRLSSAGEEHVDDAVDGLGGRRGVQGGEHQVAGLGRGQRQADGLDVAHFADQDV